MGALRAACGVVALATAIAACAPPPTLRAPAPAPERAGRPAPERFPSRDYEAAAAQGKPVYRVDPARSLVAITVRRGGSLARLGHDHVVASRDMQGYVAPDEGRADLYVPLNDLTIDEPALRAEAGLDTTPSDADIAGTRSNMLDKVLEAQKFPFALIRVRVVDKSATAARLGIAMTIHGVTRTLEVPAQMAIERGEISVDGQLEFDQSDFGIVPFSIFGGAIQVQDRLSLRFRILGTRTAPWSAQ